MRRVGHRCAGRLHQLRLPRVAMARTSHRINQGRLGQILVSPTGPVARDMLRRGLLVEGRAKQLLAGGSGRPARIDTGRLRASITTRMVVDRGVPVARIGTGVRYALWVHEGTGIYGPRRTVIRPRRAKVLRFKPKGSTRFIYRPQVRGMKPNRFLVDALPAARG